MSKILVAEDDKFLQSAYKVKLTKEGFEIKTAADGNEVLEVLKTFTPDLILLDIVMPNKDGFAALSEIKKDPKLKDIPVLITSSLSQKEDVQKGKDLGAVEYVVKSDTSLKDLVAKIHQLLSKNNPPKVV
jgi:two-component system, OmpR family, alkaline phosphatase synthesis response regulator PhoP